MNGSIINECISGNKCVPDFIHGGIDGLVTTFAVINGAIGMGLNLKTVIILGIINILADGFTIAKGKYISAKAEVDIYAMEGKKRLLSPIESAMIIFFSFMVCGLVPIIPLVLKMNNDGNVPIKSGLGCLNDVYYIMMCVFSLLTLYIMGYFKGVKTFKDPRKSGLEILLMGSGAAFIAVTIGYFLNKNIYKNK